MEAYRLSAVSLVQHGLEYAMYMLVAALRSPRRPLPASTLSLAQYDTLGRLEPRPAPPVLSAPPPRALAHSQDAFVHIGARTPRIHSPFSPFAASVAHPAKLAPATRIQSSSTAPAAPRPLDSRAYTRPVIRFPLARHPAAP
ncbi:hypothetical protein VTO73DRAFT_13835 [Trametes versicolor]